MGSDSKRVHLLIVRQITFACLRNISVTCIDVQQGQIQNFWKGVQMHKGGFPSDILPEFLNKFSHEIKVIWSKRGVPAKPINPFLIRHCANSYF